MSILISFEGINGAGKTTLINKLYQTLLPKLENKQISLYKTKEDDTTKYDVYDELTNKIYPYLVDDKMGCSEIEKLLIAILTRSRHYNKILKNIYPKTRTVILMDRFYDTTLVYHDNNDVMRAVNSIITNYNTLIKSLHILACDGYYIKPHRTYLLDVLPEIAKQRDPNSPDLDTLTNIRLKFLNLTKQFPENNRIITINANQPEDMVFRTVKDDVIQYLNSVFDLS